MRLMKHRIQLAVAEDYHPFQVLTTEEIVKHMVESIKEVNTVVQVGIFKNTHIMLTFYSNTF